MLIYLVIYIVILFLGIAIKPNSSLKRKRIFMLISFVLLICISACRDYTVGIDLKNHYYSNYKIIGGLSWDNVSSFTNKYEIGYLYFQKITSVLFQSQQAIIIITSIFILGTFGWFIYKNSEDCYISTIFFVTFMYFQWFTLLAQGMAIAIILIGIQLFLKKDKYLGFIVTTIIASTFHSSAIFCLFFILLNKIRFKKWSIIYVSLFGLVIFLGYQHLFSFATKILPEYARYETSESLVRHRAGYININSLVNIFILLVIWLIGYFTLTNKKDRQGKKINFVSKVNNKISNDFLLYSSFCALLFRTMIIKMNTLGRVSYYFYPLLLIILPRIFKSIDNNRIAREYKYIFYIFMTAYFFIVTCFWADGLYGIIPYKVFF